MEERLSVKQLTFLPGEILRRIVEFRIVHIDHQRLSIEKDTVVACRKLNEATNRRINEKENRFLPSERSFVPHWFCGFSRRSDFGSEQSPSESADDDQREREDKSGTNQFRCISVTFSEDNLLLSFLFRSFDYKDRSLSFLLGDLFGFNGGRVLRTETQFGDGHIVQENVEVLRTFDQIDTNQVRHLLTLSDQLRGIEFSYDTFQNFVTKRW